MSTICVQDDHPPFSTQFSDIQLESYSSNMIKRKHNKYLHSFLFSYIDGYFSWLYEYDEEEKKNEKNFLT